MARSYRRGPLVPWRDVSRAASGALALLLLPSLVAHGRERRAVVPADQALAAGIALDQLRCGARVPDDLQVAPLDQVAADHELDVREVPRDLHVAALHQVAATAGGHRVADQDVGARALS